MQRTLGHVFAILLIGTGASPVALATRSSGCSPGEADPSTYTMMAVPPYGRQFYVEERPQIDPGPAIPFSGFLFGGQTWVYEESNGLTGLQRGFAGIGCLIPEPLCTIPDGDDASDPNCGHGPDTPIIGFQSPLYQD